MKNNSYILIAVVIFIFGIFALPKIIDRLSPEKLVKFEKVPPFRFTDQNGNTITNDTYKDKVYVVEFFFTHCPTICPKMNANMVKIQNHFYGNPDFGIASFSIDPERDTPETLKAYAREKGATLKNWHFMTGDKATIYRFANEGFKLYAGENPEAEGGFEHSGLFALIDKDGYIRSRKVKIGENENPIKFYDGLDDKQIRWIIEDIEKLLKE